MAQDRMLNARYVGVHGAYWGSNGFIVCFASVFLLERGFTNGEIGIVLALANLLAAVVQPPLAAFADRMRRLTLSQIGNIITGIAAVMAVALVALPNLFAPTAALFLLMTTCHLILQPVLISMGSFFIIRGYKLNFGFARGVGSLMYAVCATFTGYLINGFGGNVILYLSLLAFALFVLLTSRLDTRKEGGAYSQAVDGRVLNASHSEENGERNGEDNAAEGSAEASEKPAGLLQFALEHKRYMLLLLGFLLIFIEHNILNNYMFQILEPLGGTAAETGTALSVAAVCEIPTMWGFVVIHRFISSSKLMRISAACFSVKGLAFVLAGSIGAVYAAQTLQMLGNAVLMVASVYYINGIVTEKDQVKGQTLFTTATTTGAVIGSFLGGQLIGLLGVDATLLTGAVISSVGTVIALAAVQGEERLRVRIRRR